MDLSNGTVTRVEKVKTFRVPEDGSGFFAYLLEPKPEEKPKPAEPNAAEPSAQRRVRTQQQSAPESAHRHAAAHPAAEEKGIRNRTRPAQHDHRHERNVQRRARLHDQQRRKDTRLHNLIAERRNKRRVRRYDRYRWSTSRAAERQRKIPATHMGRRQHSTRVHQRQRRRRRKATEVSRLSLEPQRSTSHRDRFDRAHRVSAKSWSSANARNLSFSLDGSRLFLGTAPPPEPEKNPDEEFPADEKVLVDLWHWKDDYVQPIQRVRAEQDRNRSYRAVYDLRVEEVCPACRRVDGKHLAVERRQLCDRF